MVHAEGVLEPRALPGLAAAPSVGRAAAHLFLLFSVCAYVRGVVWCGVVSGGMSSIDRLVVWYCMIRSRVVVRWRLEGTMASVDKARGGGQRERCGWTPFGLDQRAAAAPQPAACMPGASRIIHTHLVGRGVECDKDRRLFFLCFVPTPDARRTPTTSVVAAEVARWLLLAGRRLFGSVPVNRLGGAMVVPMSGLDSIEGGAPICLHGVVEKIGRGRRRPNPNKKNHHR